MTQSKKQQSKKRDTQTTTKENLIDDNYEPDACDVVAIDLTADEDLPAAKGGVA